MEKVCFVIMGFGKRTDYENNRKVNLDYIYKNVIETVFEANFSEFKLIRADEVSTSRIIDIDMYDLLLRADLVIADITTLNPNAIYELGVRHALKPFSTIIIADELSDLPFDINRNRIMKYPEVGEKLTDSEIDETSSKLLAVISETLRFSPVDSPFYTFFPTVNPPKVSDIHYSKIVEKAEKKDLSIRNLMDKALEYMSKDEFNQAFFKWDELSIQVPDNSYFIQQKTLAKYKSKLPTETEALQEALDIIKTLSPDSTLDTETLGLTGSIFKQLYSLNGRNDYYLKEAIKYYKKGYVIQNDYYNGENYLNCLILKLENPNLSIEEKRYIEYEVGKESGNIISILELIINGNSSEINTWMYATLAVCYLYKKNIPQFLLNKDKFIELCDISWNINSFTTTVTTGKKLLGLN